MRTFLNEINKAYTYKKTCIKIVLVLLRAACHLIRNEQCLQSSEEKFFANIILYPARLSIKINIFSNVRPEKKVTTCKEEANASRKQEIQ